MFISAHLNKIHMEQSIRDFKNDDFYVSHQFILLKEHIKDLNNYNSSAERRKDYLNAIDLGIEFNNIFSLETTIRFFLYKIKDEMYIIDKSDIYDFLIPLFMLINKCKGIVIETENKYGKESDRYKIKKYILKELEQVQEVLNNRLS